jgi:hypothetical protein
MSFHAQDKTMLFCQAVRVCKDKRNLITAWFLFWRPQPSENRHNSVNDILHYEMGVYNYIILYGFSHNLLFNNIYSFNMK